MRKIPILGVLLFLCVGVCQANDMYVAQNGNGSGASCSNAQPISWFNNSANWGTGSSQIGPGTTVHLCGAITTPLTINGSGTGGNVISFHWESGARISVAHGGVVNLNGSNSYLLFDGGFACGPGTACDAVEAVNQTGYASGQTGIIEATANGTGLANQDISTQAFYGGNNNHDIEVRNLIVRNLYRHTSPSDLVPNVDTGTWVLSCSESNSGCASGVVSLHDSSIHDMGDPVSFEKTSGTTLNVYNNDFYHDNWSVENSGDGTRTVNIHDNHVHDASNWDTGSNDWYHHNFIHNYMNTPSDSLAINVYNNLSDGNWGTCCTTATLLFVELDSPNNFNVFNNVDLQACDGETAPSINYSANGGVFANNTFIGCASTSQNVEAILLSSENGGTGPLNINFQNNAIQGYGQYIVVASGATFTNFDYNFYGPVGMSGNPSWGLGGSGISTFGAWKSACSCDSHGGNPSSFTVNSSGQPQSGALINAATNLTSLGMTPLGSTTSAGNTVSPASRPASGAWTVGAYGTGGTVGTVASQLLPPTALSATVQ